MFGIIAAAAVCFGCYPLPPPLPVPPVCDLLSRPNIAVSSRSIKRRNLVELKLNVGPCERNLVVTGPSGEFDHTLVSGELTIHENPLNVNLDGTATWTVAETAVIDPRSWEFEIRRLSRQRTEAEIMRGSMLFDGDAGVGVVHIPISTYLREEFEQIGLDWENDAGVGTERNLWVGESAYVIQKAHSPALPNEFYSWQATHRFANPARGDHLEVTMTEPPGPFVAPPGFEARVALAESNLLYNRAENSTGFARTEALSMVDVGPVPLFAFINPEIDTPVRH